MRSFVGATRGWVLKGRACAVRCTQTSRFFCLCIAAMSYRGVFATHAAPCVFAGFLSQVCDLLAGRCNNDNNSWKAGCSCRGELVLLSLVRRANAAQGLLTSGASRIGVDNGGSYCCSTAGLEPERRDTVGIQRESKRNNVSQV